MIRAVIDTTVFVRALINPYSRCGRLLFEHAGSYTIVMSRPIAQGILEVIQRPELTTKYRGLRRIDMRRAIDLIAMAEAVDVETIWPVSRDPNDDVFVATAIAGKAGYIVSEDKDLLSLREVNGIQIVDARQFIELFEPENPTDT